MLDLEGEAWTGVLRDAMGAEVVRAGVHRNMLVTIFRAGPFRVAYPDFPGGFARYSLADVDALRGPCSDLGVDVIRMHANHIDRGLCIAWSRPLGSIKIEDLQGWRENAVEKARRARSREARLGVSVERSVAADGDHLYQLYADMVSSHGGRERYTRAYFRGLAALGCLTARAERRLIGFVCSGHIGETAYYMHGAHCPKARHLYPSDILMRRMILEAKEAGMTSLDFLPSPAAQSGLERYKIAWGGTQIPFVAFDVALNPLKAWAFRQAKDLIDRVPLRLAARLSLVTQTGRRRIG
jgi:hypothetical protein